MQMLTVGQAKEYLRVDSDFEDSLVESLLLAAESLCRGVARLSMEEWDDLCKVTVDDEGKVTEIHCETHSLAEILQMRELLRIAVLYAVGYLFEHREQADHHDLVLTLRSLLFSIREGVL